MQSDAFHLPEQLDCPGESVLCVPVSCRWRRTFAMTRATMSVAADGATPSPRPTIAREKHSPASAKTASGQICRQTQLNPKQLANLTQSDDT